jgi:hypothetical protein
VADIHTNLDRPLILNGLLSYMDLETLDFLGDSMAKYSMRIRSRFGERKSREPRVDSMRGRLQEKCDESVMDALQDLRSRTSTKTVRKYLMEITGV